MTQEVSFTVVSSGQHRPQSWAIRGKGVQIGLRQILMKNYWKKGLIPVTLQFPCFMNNRHNIVTHMLSC